MAPADEPTVAELQRVYGGALDAFTAERDALARELRSAGRTAAAAGVKALKKPPLSVWLVNRLARDRARELAALFEAGAALASAQAAALAGKGADALREASGRQRDAVAALAAAAAELLREGGHPEEPWLQRVRRTLQALPTATPEELEALRAGILDHELEPAAFGALLAAAPMPAPKPAAKEKKPEPPRETAADRERRRKELQAAKDALKTAEAELRREEKARDRAAASVEATTARVQEAESELASAREAALRARKDADEAALRVAEAQGQAGAARAKLEALERG